ncbi:heterocyst frequency control protein PatD [Microcoleus sp. A2-C5]|uniref:heterocyst frequency control protein PatD n=1 Tax=Microcoleaceae TaxID=1892252 RepID=UPI002237CD62|nr:heterocyst frequency control protein PatD [Lyngbya sp. CCAP 1446/10]
MILSEDRRQCYQELQQALEQLQRTAAQDNLDRAALAIEYRKVQQFFGNQIMRAPSGELDTSDTPPEQSYLTEIHKQLRLLGTDVTFLQAAKQPATAEARQSAANSRINTLIGYCGAVLQKNSGAERARPDAELITELTGNKEGKEK